MRFDDRFAGGDRELLRKQAAELVGFQPDVVLADASASVAALKQASRTVPIVFAEVTDPVGGGLVESLARPGGNATGFLSEEYGFAAKWLELLKQIAPRVTRAAVLRDPVQFAGVANFAAIQAVAPSLRAEPIPIDVRDADTMKHSLAEFARGTNGGLVVLPSFAAQILRQAIVALAAQLRPCRQFHFRSRFHRGRRPHILRVRRYRPIPACRRFGFILLRRNKAIAPYIS